MDNGWGGWIRTTTVCINSAASYQLDHAPSKLILTCRNRLPPNGECQLNPILFYQRSLTKKSSKIQPDAKFSATLSWDVSGSLAAAHRCSVKQELGAPCRMKSSSSLHSKTFLLILSMVIFGP